MKNMPKITIVTITYNLIKAGRKEMFRKCVESVHNQTYQNIEHIVIDGASNDGTVDLLQEYQDKGWIKYYSEPDNGIYDAMNKGIKKTTGEYISFLNSDDFYHNENAVQEIVNVLTDSDIDYCYGLARYIKENGDYFGILRNTVCSWFVRMPLCHQTLFVKTDLIRNLDGFDSDSFKSAGDYDFIIRMMLSGAKGKEIPCEIVSYRLGGLSDVQQEQSIKECIKSFEKNYGSLFPGLNYKKIFNNSTVPYQLFKVLQSKVSDENKKLMQLAWDTAVKKRKNIRQITLLPKVINKVETNEEKFITIYKLFGFIPLMKTKLKCNVKRYLLCGVLPVLKLKLNSDKVTSHLFCVIPLTYKSNRNGVYKIRILGIPLLKIKR